MKAVFNKIISGEIGPTKYFTNPVLTRDGEERIISWHNAMITDREGRFVGTLSSGEDVTEREHWEEELKLRSQILDDATDSIFLHDSEGNFMYVNETACRSRGYSRDELMEMNLFGQLDTPEYAKRKEQNLRELREKGTAMFEAAHLCKDGSEIPVEVRAHVIESGGEKLILGIARDITERRKAEKELKLRSQLLDSATDSIFVHDFEGNFLYVNETACRFHGYSKEEFMQKKLQQIVAPERVSCLPGEFQLMLDKGQAIFESAHMSKDGSIIPVEVHGRTLEYGSNKLLLTVCRDISDRKSAEQALKENEKRYRLLVEISPDAIFVQSEGKIVFMNSAGAKLLGADRPEQLVGKPLMNFVHPDYRQIVTERIRKAIKEKTIIPTMEEKYLRLDGTAVDVEVKAVPFIYQGKFSFQVVVRDITERNKMGEELKLRAQLLDNATDFIFLRDLDGNYLYANETALKNLGYSREELLKLKPNQVTTTPTSIRKSLIKEVLAKGTVTYETGSICKDGSIIPTEAHSQLIELGGKKLVLGTSRDITERKKAEEELKLRAQLIDNANDSIFLHDFDGNFVYINETMCKSHGYSREELMNMKLPALITPEYGRLLGQKYQDLIEKGYDIFESAHFHKDGSILPVEIHSRLIELDDKKLILTIARNITERKQAEEKLKKSYAKLQKTIQGAIEAIGTIAETRDPYTAGHQQRVAKLAAAIAEEMNLPKRKIETIHVAGILHDIGKINVPAEILSKPSKLNQIEMDLIKTHPQIGREILKSLELPWPICQIVLQHHERADGSGYPNGLLGDNITIEARILAVADVVEAMASHRPYRPSLGIEKALEEISKNRGTLYDPDVVDACLKVFQEKGFKFE